MHCSTPQTTMPRWLCGVFMVQIASLRNGLIGLVCDVTREVKAAREAEKKKQRRKKAVLIGVSAVIGATVIGQFGTSLLSGDVMLCPVLSCFTLPALFCPALFCPALPFPALSCSILLYPALLPVLPFPVPSSVPSHPAVLSSLSSSSSLSSLLMLLLLLF